MVPIFTNEQLRELIKGNCIGTTFPYDTKNEAEIEGVLINISRLAPVAIFGDDEPSKTLRIETGEVIGACRSSIMGGYALKEVDDQFQPMIRQLTNVLAEFDFDVLANEYLNQALPFKAKIPTLYSEPRDYTIADAIFYWED